MFKRDQIPTSRSHMLYLRRKEEKYIIDRII